ncbi:MAG TPA: helix-turn-helix domain-containing protein, partial [Steroidobacteraceae bacterium]|nr:helix-turn-helix domain-containing protein [Steroidobacteraceae bacterium]
SKRDRTAARLSQTAFELFEKHGYDAVTMEQIAAVGDVSKVTLYKYFPIKEALLAHRFREEIASGMKSFGEKVDGKAPFAIRMQQLLSASAAWNESRRVLMPHYLKFRFSKAGSAPQFRSGVYAIVEQLFRQAQSNEEIRQDIPATELAWMFEMLCFGAVVAWLNDERRSLKRRFQSVLDVTLNGISIQETPRKPRTAGRRRK